MPTGNEPYTILDHGWIVRLQTPLNNSAPRALLLLHGWTGDETVMWIFTRSLPDNYWILAPRGPVSAPEKGYGWLPNHTTWPKLYDFEAVSKTLHVAIQGWMKDLHLPSLPVDIMGFSQGAAMAYAFSAYYPQYINKIIALAGFLPRDEEMPGKYHVLNGKQIYIAHGTKDETIPVAMAREAVQELRKAGADILYCESEVGHKLSASCVKGLTSFID